MLTSRCSSDEEYMPLVAWPINGEQNASCLEKQWLFLNGKLKFAISQLNFRNAVWSYQNTSLTEQCFILATTAHHAQPIFSLLFLLNLVRNHLNVKWNFILKTLFYQSFCDIQTTGDAKWQKLFSLEIM